MLGSRDGSQELRETFAGVLGPGLLFTPAECGEERSISDLSIFPKENEAMELRWTLFCLIK